MLFKSLFEAFIHGISFLVNPIQSVDIPFDEEALRSDWQQIGLDMEDVLGGYNELFKRNL